MRPDQATNSLGQAGRFDRLRLRQCIAAAGPWLKELPVGPIEFANRHTVDVLVGIYLVTDAAQRLVYVGQARRDGGVLARLDGHALEPEKLEAFAWFWILPLHDRTGQRVINAIEGRIADELGLRGRLLVRGLARRWPSSSGWMALVASKEAQLKASAASR